MKIRRPHGPAWAAALLILLLLGGCAALLGGGGGAPTVTITAPPNGSTVAVGEGVTVAISAEDPSGPGITRIELFVNGASLRVDDAPGGGQALYQIAPIWMPEAEGEARLMAIAYRGDGTASAPASIVLTVVGLSPDPSQGGDGEVPTEEAPTQEGPPPTPVPEGTQWEQGRVTTGGAAIRSGPGPFCDIIGSANRDDTLNLMEYSADELWLMTDYLGPDEIGWIWIENIIVIGDDSKIPRGNKLGCLGCGDGVCTGAIGEDCATCAEDCGACCGNRTCEPGRGEDCATCPTDCGACCGNGTCELTRGETCLTCATDCGACCGNGVCDPVFGETCTTCPRDCGSCCGNGICEPALGESFSTCPADCLG